MENLGSNFDGDIQLQIEQLNCLVNLESNANGKLQAIYKGFR